MKLEWVANGNLHLVILLIKSCMDACLLLSPKSSLTASSSPPLSNTFVIKFDVKL